MENEVIWKDIILDNKYYYFEKYECSNTGLIRYKESKKLVKIFDSYRHNRKKQHWKRCFLYFDMDHYYKVSVHRIIAFTFIPNPDPDKYIEVNHIDGNPENNNVDNLEWVTKSQNMIHAYKNNLIKLPIGGRRKEAIFDDDDVRAVVYLMKQGMKAKEIYFNLYELGLSYNPILTRERINSLMKHIRKGTQWKHIYKKV